MRRLNLYKNWQAMKLKNCYATVTWNDIIGEKVNRKKCINSNDAGAKTSVVMYLVVAITRISLSE